MNSGIIPAELDSYDWESAFEYASNPEVVIGETTPDSAGFAREDVARIIHLRPGENDGPEWLGAFELRDGRFAFLSAGCDYTGWDCHSSGHSAVAGSLEALIQYGMTQGDRLAFGLETLEEINER